MTPTSAPQPLGRRLLPILLLATLTVALGLLLTAPGNVRAEEPEPEEPTLAEYEVEWLQYPEKNTAPNKEGVGSVVWGGGSFLKLVGKLSIEGCNVNAIAIYEPDGTKITHLHHFQAPDFVNPTFSDGQYMKYIPKGSRVAFTCVDACDILVGPNQDRWEDELNRDRCLSYDYNPIASRFALTSDCTDDFTEEVKRHLLTRVPIFQDTCIMYFSRKNSNNVPWGLATQSIVLSAEKPGNVFFRAFQPMVLVDNDNVVWNGDDVITDDEWRYMIHIDLIMHELCHQQQKWYASKFYYTYNTANRGEYIAWEDTQAGKEFREIVGYTQDGDGDWIFDEDNYYWAGTSRPPSELSANVCAGYLVEKVYEGDYPDVPEGQRDVPRKMLTPEMREWVEKYMIIG